MGHCFHVLSVISLEFRILILEFGFKGFSKKTGQVGFFFFFFFFREKQINELPKDRIGKLNLIKPGVFFNIG